MIGKTDPPDDLVQLLVECGEDRESAFFTVSEAACTAMGQKSPNGIGMFMLQFRKRWVKKWREVSK